MTNLADTSRAAFRAVDVTAGQARVLAVFAKWTNITRHEIADKSGLPLQSVCGRVNELLKSGALIELDATREGRHLLQLNEKRGGISVGTEAGSSVCQPDRAPPHAAPSETHADTPPPVSRADAAPNWVSYYVPGRWSMGEDAARSILNHAQIKLIPDWCVNEARKVMQEGRHWVWS